jgi:hypothetical protein
MSAVLNAIGAPDTIRTCDPCLRSNLTCPSTGFAPMRYIYCRFQQGLVIAIKLLGHDIDTALAIFAQ